MIIDHDDDDNDKHPIVYDVYNVGRTRITVAATTRKTIPFTYVAKLRFCV